MIREFHDEISRLREELEKYGGAALTQQGTMNEAGEYVVEKVVYVDNKDKMQKMEQAIEKEI